MTRHPVSPGLAARFPGMAADAMDGPPRHLSAPAILSSPARSPSLNI
ncbi:MAG: hypothetical protein AB7E29_04630 [Xanthobacter sp.]